jgi:hypothetical protein
LGDFLKNRGKNISGHTVPLREPSENSCKFTHIFANVKIKIISENFPEKEFCNYSKITILQEMAACQEMIIASIK